VISGWKDMVTKNHMEKSCKTANIKKLDKSRHLGYIIFSQTE